MKPCKYRRVIAFAIITLLIVAFIWSNSCKSGAESGAQSGRVTRFLQSILDPDGKIPEENFRPKSGPFYGVCHPGVGSLRPVSGHFPGQWLGPFCNAGAAGADGGGSG